jgi:hypothetical protein
MDHYYHGHPRITTDRQIRSPPNSKSTITESWSEEWYSSAAYKLINYPDDLYSVL